MPGTVYITVRPRLSRVWRSRKKGKAAKAGK
jgi:hypothetical protein